jgi:nucleoside-diphosphate-sugar epimerase
VSTSSILVIGGSGFIGTRLVGRLVASGHDVAIADRVRSESYPDRWIACDVRDLEALRAAVRGRAEIINLAAEHRDDVSPRRLYDEVNVEGARLVCRAAAEAGIRRIVFTSSVAVYGFASAEMSEEAPLRPFNDYGRTKRDAEAVYDAWHAGAPDRRLVVMRPTVVFGERNRGNVYNLLRQLASGMFVMIGPGTNRKSMAYVENVAACLEWSLGLPPGRHLFNYADKPDYDMNGLVAEVRRSLGRSGAVRLRIPVFAGLAAGRVFDAAAALTGKRFPISAVRVRKFTESTMIAAHRVREMGFTPPVAIEAALRRTLAAEFGAGAS